MTRRALSECPRKVQKGSGTVASSGFEAEAVRLMKENSF